MVNFVVSRAVDAAFLLEDSLKTADVGDLSVLADETARLFVTKGGFKHAEMDEGARRIARSSGSVDQKRASKPLTTSGCRRSH